MPVIQVKSMPGTLVAMPPILIGSPVAFWPVPAPHLPDACRLPPPVPPDAVVAAPAAVVAAPAAVVAAGAAVVAAAPAAAVVPDDDELSPPHAVINSTPAPAMASKE